MYKQKSGKQKGQTLVEVLIYIAIFGTVATSLIGIVWNVTKIHSYQVANNEVDSNLSYAMNLINDKIRSASSVESATGSTLVLRMSNNTTTTFSVTDGVLYLQEGSADPVAVISDRVAVSSLNFEKIDMAGAKGGARVSMTLNYVPKEGTSSEVQKTLISAITRSATAISFSEDIVPGQNNSYSVGSSSLNWKNGFFSGDLTVSGTLKGTTLCIGTDCKTAWGQVSGVTGSGTTNYVTKWASTGTLGNSVIYDNGTSVGIGTTSPSTPLHIYSTASNPALITLQHSGGTSTIGAYSEGIRIADGDAGYFFDNGAVNLGNSGHSQPVIVRGSQLDVDEELVVSGTGNSSFVGNVGIGTTSPAAPLDVTVNSSANQPLTIQLTNTASGAATGNAIQFNTTSAGANKVAQIRSYVTATGVGDLMVDTANANARGNVMT